MSQGITLAKALDVFSGELGCGGENYRDDLLDSVQASLEFLLLNGGGELLREWVVTVRNGKFTLPLDLETPLKYKVGSTATLGYGSINSPYYSYGSQSVSSCCGYSDWNSLQIQINANKVPTAFKPPDGVALRLLATTKDERDVGKNLMVNGKRYGLPVLPTHNGFKTAGELLPIFLEGSDDIAYGAWEFDDITGVIKDYTCAYVMLSGIDECNNTYFLSHYTPDETVPQYTECQLFNCNYGCGNSCDFFLHMLGRVKPGIRYIRNEDILPISSVEILRLLAKRARYDQSGDFQEVAVLEQRIATTIRKQVAYQQAPIRALSYNLSGSGASLSNI